MDGNDMGGTARVGDRVDDAVLQRVDGTDVRLSALVAGPTVVPIVRYFGCMPCRDFLRALDERSDEWAAAGFGLLGVGRAADHQARALMDAGVSYELVLDPDQRLYEALQLRRFPWWRMLEPGTWWRYLRALRRARQGAVTNHPLQSPGVVVLDGDLRVLHLHRGRTVGDYPEPGALLAELSRRSDP